MPVIDDMVRAAKGLVLDGHGAHAALRDSLANQFFRQDTPSPAPTALMMACVLALSHKGVSGS